MIKVIGKIIDTPAEFDEQGGETSPATYLPGFHVDANYPVPELAPYLLDPQPETPSHQFAGAKTYAYRFDDQAAWDDFVTENSDEEGNLTVTPPKRRPPKEVTRRQFIQQLILSGLDETVDAAINAIENPLERKLTRAWLEQSQVFEIDRSELQDMVVKLGLTEEYKEDFFREAAKL